MNLTASMTLLYIPFLKMTQVLIIFQPYFQRCKDEVLK